MHSCRKQLLIDNSRCPFQNSPCSRGFPRPEPFPSVGALDGGKFVVLAKMYRPGAIGRRHSGVET